MPRKQAHVSTGEIRDGLDEGTLVDLLRKGDERAFGLLVDRYHGSLLRFATSVVDDRMVAEELVQDTWLALVRGIERFEQRSTLKTWLFHVLTYKLRQRTDVERRLRTLPLIEDPSVSPDRFRPEGDRWPRHWAAAILDWHHDPDRRYESQELMAHVRTLIDALPPRQRAVILLRDVEGLLAAETCKMLDITDGVERVLLHRARSRVRLGLAQYLVGEQAGP